MTLKRLLAIVLTLMAVPALWAQQDEATKVGFVDTQVVLNESETIREIVGEIDEELGNQARRIEQQKQKAETLRSELETRSSVLSDSARRAKEQEVIDVLSRVEELEFRFRREFQRKQRRAVEPILTEMLKVVRKVANEEGFDLVVRGEMVLYGNNAVDLAGRVAEELDKRREELRAIIIPSSGEESGNSEKSSEDSDANQEESKERESLPLVP